MAATWQRHGSDMAAPPPPQRVKYNDWRQVEVPPVGQFTPELPVSVIVSCRARPLELARTLAALECQTYPRELVEVVVVDDGSPEPLVPSRTTSLAAKVVRQEDQCIRPAAVRNAGVRAAANDILVFLDAAAMPEPELVAAHACWHHVVPDALTLGTHAAVGDDGIRPDRIRSRLGALAELLEGRRVDLEVARWNADILDETSNLTANADDHFRLVAGGNFGVRREFFDRVGGFDESFTQRGGEDTEFGWRAFVRGGLMVPVREAVSWHQGSGEDGRSERNQSRHLQQPKLAQLVAHPRFRGQVPGRSYEVPRFVVTLQGGMLRAERLLGAVERILSGSVHDLVVCVELSDGHPGCDWLTRSFGPDPRVQVAPAESALDVFPSSPFHITLPAWVELHGDVVRRLHHGLGTAVMGRAELPHQSSASITRAWALHRAQRTPWQVSDFGDVIEISARNLLADPDSAQSAPVSPPATEDAAPAALPVESPQAGDSLGVEIMALGVRSAAVFQAPGQAAQDDPGRAVDLVVADTPAEAANAQAPVVALSEVPPLLSTPAFDPLRYNPINWPYHHDETVGALGPLDQLPANSSADRIVSRNDAAGLKALHHLEDTAAFHAGPVARAGELVRLAAMGVVVHLADGDARLAPYLGDPLFALMTRDARGLDAAQREMQSIRLRRTALREHSRRGRVRQLCAQAGIEPPPLPLVSVLLVTKRPRLLQHALAAVARQTYPRLELILGLHGEGFADVDQQLAAVPVPTTVVRIDAAQPLGAALNRAAAAATGTFLAKMDDDDAYGREHVWDLVLAQEYAQAVCVAKALRYFFLQELNATIHMRLGSERNGLIGGGSTMLVEREAFARAGGFPRIDTGEDVALMQSLKDQRERIYRTHGAGYVPVRHEDGHTWEVGKEWFVERAAAIGLGWDPERNCIDDMELPYLPPAVLANFSRNSINAASWGDRTGSGAPPPVPSGPAAAFMVSSSAG